MIKSLIYRQNKLFKINIELLPIEARKTKIINSLYAALYFEFRGASENDKYNKMLYTERMEALNNFARKWFTKRGYKLND